MASMGGLAPLSPSTNLLSLVYSGIYNWYNGNLSGQDGGGNWWTYVGVDNPNAYDLATNASRLILQHSANRTNGMALRGEKSRESYSYCLEVSSSR